MVKPDGPYFAGHIVDEPARQVVGPPPVLAWIGVYAVNLIVPIYLGLLVTSEGGRIGMVFGGLVMFVLGYRACFTYREAVCGVTYGGWLVAVAQLFPMLHLFAGMIGVGVAQATGQATMSDFGQVNTVLGGFLATLVTGGILMAFAAALSLLKRVSTSSSEA